MTSIRQAFDKLAQGPVVRARRRPRAYLITECARAAAIDNAGSPLVRRRSRAAENSGRRLEMCAVAFVAAFGLLAVRLGYVAFDGSRHPDLAALSVRALVAAPRPEIVDRHGALIAVDRPSKTLLLAGPEVWNEAEAAAAIKTVLPDIDVAGLTRRLEAGHHVEVARNLTSAEADALFSLGLTGARFISDFTRYYPQGRAAAHLVGHTEPGRGGVMGLEQYLDARSVRRNPAEPLVATLDLRAQQILEAELSAAMEKFGASAAWGGVLDISTGEMLALASLPDFDPGAPGAAPADNRRNRAVYDRYELGSAFKVFTAAAAIEAGTASETSVYDARNGYKVADRIIRDYRGKNRVLSFTEVLQHSSNIGAARMAADLGPGRQRAALQALGLLETLPIELAERRAPDFPRRWGPVEAATISYGHGIAVTPLHLLAAFAASVGDGVYRTPTFVRGEPNPPGRRAFSEGTAAVMRRALRRVVTGGSSSQAEAPGYFPIGKTATADKPSNGGYDRNARISTFIGAFPGHAPRYAVLVSLDNPQAIEGTHGFATAGWNAAPVFAAAVSRLAPVLGVLPVEESVAVASFMGLDADAGRPAVALADRRESDAGQPGADL